MSQDSLKQKQVINLLGAICGEAAQLLQQLTGKEHRVVILALDGETVQYGSPLPPQHIKQACQVVAEQITSIEGKNPKRLILPESVRQAMN